MSNYSDDEDLRPRVIAEARKEEWSDDDDEVDAGLVNPAESEFGTVWSDAEVEISPEIDSETETEPAGAIFGSSTDRVGDIRTKASKLRTDTVAAVDKYVKRAGDEAKKVRAARQKLKRMRDQSLSALKRVEKDKNLSDDAKTVQRTQHEIFTKPVTGELARLDKELAEQEEWLNAVLLQRRLPFSSAKASSRAKEPELEKFYIGPGNTSEKTVDRPRRLLLSAGMRIDWGNGETHTAGPDGQVVKLRAGLKYTVSNRMSRKALYMYLE